MSIIKLGNGVTDITGKFAGQHYKRDRSGVHVCSIARKVRKRTTAQAKQRNAFRKARTHDKTPQVSAANIYRALNDLELV